MDWSSEGKIRTLSKRVQQIATAVSEDAGRGWSTYRITVEAKLL